MEKIRQLIRPDEFGSLKVVKNTLEFIRLEGDVRDRSRLNQVLARLDSQCLKLEGFPSAFKVRAVEAKDDFPTRHSWDSYFRDAKHMNELKAGERPDTIHISGLPVKWFSEDDSKIPSEILVKKVFNKWGTLRRVDVPAADSYRSRMRLGQNIQKFSFEDGLFFDAYVQYIEYMDFVRAMDALRGMKLLKKEDKSYLTASIKVDFDKTKHMSDNSVSHRAFERKRLVAQDNLAAEKIRKREELEIKRKEELKKQEEVDNVAKEIRQKRREERRKRNILTVFRKQEEDKVSMKIAREERKLIKAQRQLESIRLLDELFDRIKIKIEKKEIDIDSKKDVDKKNASNDDNKSDNEKTKKDKKSKKKKSKKNKKKNKKSKESNSSVSENSDTEKNTKKIKSISVKNVQKSNTSDSVVIPYPTIYPRFEPQSWYYDTPLPVIYPHSGRGFSRERRNRINRGRNFSNWRNSPRTANSLNPNFFYNKQYYKYFASLSGQDYNLFDDCDRDSRSRSRKLSISRSRSRSQSRRSRRHRRSSKSNSRIQTGSRSRSGSGSKHRSRSKSNKRSRSKSTSHQNRNYNRTRSKIKSRSRSRSKRVNVNKSRSKSRSRSTSRTRNNRSPSKVKITRAKSKTPVKRNKSRSSSWSLPKTPEKKRSYSWSQSPDKNK